MVKTILIVDDSSTALLFHKKLLDVFNVKILTAKNGTEAIAKCNQNIDLIIMDVEMPNMNGYEACKQIKNNPETKNIPIILLTSRSELDNVRKGFEAGCNSYLNKPVDSRQLIGRVKNYLGI